ncbi:MAG: S8 family serine peptidase [Gammaproteobacteria bacterium]|nr:S8 family serine peptidase [Gammaproteobacteria bacterium]
MIRVTSKKIIMLLLVVVNYVYAINDPKYPEQWYLNGSSHWLFGYDAIDIGFQRFKDSGFNEEGENVTFVIAQGVEVNHPELKNKMWTNPNEVIGNGIDDDENGFVDDIHGINTFYANGDIYDDLIGWGTGLSGIIAAEQNNNLGVSGVSAKTKIAHCALGFEANEIGEVNWVDFVPQLDMCFEYVISLKRQGVKISSILMLENFPNRAIFSNGWILGQADLKDALKPIFQKLSDEDILLIAPVSPCGHYFPIDNFPQTPQVYRFPNQIIVDGFLSEYEPGVGVSFTSCRGTHSVDVMAPVSYVKMISPEPILKTPAEPLHRFSPSSSEGVETVNFLVSDEEYFSGNESWKIDPHEEQESFIYLPAIDLSDFKEQGVIINIMSKGVAGFASEHQVYLQYEGEYGWSIIDQTRAYQSLDWESTQYAISSELISDWERRGIDLEQIKFRVRADADVPSGYNFHIDEITAFATQSSEEIDWQYYLEIADNSLAAAQVAGAVATLKSVYPDMSNNQIKNRLMVSGTPNPQWTPGTPFFDYMKSSLNNKILNLYQGDGSGAIDCQGQEIKRRIKPSTNSPIMVVENKDMQIQSLSIKCDGASGDVTYTDSKWNKTFTSKDDGKGFDSIANDGLNVTSFNFQDIGWTEVAMPGEFPLEVLVVKPYLVRKVRLVENEILDTSNGMDFPLSFGGVVNAYREKTSFWIDFFKGNISLSFPYPPEPEVIPRKHQAKASSVALKKWHVFDSKQIKDTKLKKKTANIDLLTFRKGKQVKSNLINSPTFESIQQPELKILDLQYTPEEISQSSFYRFRSFGRNWRTDDRYMYTIELKYFSSTNGDLEPFSGRVQAIFFENKSTIIISYMDFSEADIARIGNRGLAIGTNYFLPLDNDFSNDTSYILKVDDGENTPPEQIESEIVLYGEHYVSFDATELFSDAEDDILIFGASSQNGISIGPFGLVQISDELIADNDEIIVDLSVDDGEELLETSVLVKLRDYSTPPSMSLNVLQLYTNEELVLDLNDYLSDPDSDTITVRLLTDSENVSLSEDNLLTLNYTKQDYPLYDNELDFIISDGGNDVSHQVTLYLNYKNHKPVNNGFPNSLSINVGEQSSIPLNQYFTDPDEDVLSFSTESDIASIVNDNQKIYLTVSPYEAGEKSVSLTVSDNDGEYLYLALLVYASTDSNDSSGNNEAISNSSGGVALGFNSVFLILLFLLRRKNVVSIVRRYR